LFTGIFEGIFSSACLPEKPAPSLALLPGKPAGILAGFLTVF